LADTQSGRSVFLNEIGYKLGIFCKVSSILNQVFFISKIEEDRHTAPDIHQGENIPKGFLSVTVEDRGQHYKQLKLYALEKCSAPLLGRDWLKIIKLDWSEIKELHITSFERTNTTVHCMKGETNDTYSGDKVK